MPVYAAEATPPADITQEKLELPEMTAQEHFLVFGSLGDESLYTMEEVEETLAWIRADALALQTDTAEAEEGDLLGTAIVTMTTGTEGINLIKRWEGLSLTAYKTFESETYYTIGYGHYGADVYAGMTITQAEAESMLASDLKSFESGLNSYIKSNNIHVNQNQFDALISFTYNLGLAKWTKSHDVPMVLKNGQERFTEEKVYAYFRQWRLSGGKVIAGLENRRIAETDVFLKPCYDICSVHRVSINVGSQLGEIIYFTLTDDVAKDSGACIRVVHGNTTMDFKVADSLTSAGGNIARVQVDIPVKSCADTITAYIYKSNGTMADIRNSNTSDSKGYHFSLDEYRSVCEQESNTKLIELIDALKTFGTGANTYFGGLGVTNPATDVTADTFADYNRTISGGVDGLEFLGYTLVLDGNMVVRYYYKISDGHSLGQYAFTVDNTAVAAQMMSGGCYVDVAIAATQIDNIYTVKASAGGQSLSVSAGALTYAKQAYAGDNTSLKNLVAAMYRYNVAAESYFGKD